MAHFRFLTATLAWTLAAVLCVGVVYAGSLTPSVSPAATSFTLEDIYTRLTTNVTATEGDHDFSPGSAPAASMVTLTDIYNAIPTIEADRVVSGTTLLGVAGTYTGTNLGYTYGDDLSAYVLGTASGSGTALVNMWNGTLGAGGFPGGSQANGGVDDLNGSNSPPSDRYAGPAGWTACTSGNNYCGTGDSGADAQDNSTGLIWSMPCNGTACSSFADDDPLFYSWDNSDSDNGSRTASELCSDHAGWYLPHQKQLMQAYINGFYGNVEEAGINRRYWSATTNASNTATAHFMFLSNGVSSTITKSQATALNVLCVRSAI